VICANAQHRRKQRQALTAAWARMKKSGSTPPRVPPNLVKAAAFGQGVESGDEDYQRRRTIFAALPLASTLTGSTELRFVMAALRWEELMSGNARDPVS
jgi:hypothetical protein